MDTMAVVLAERYRRVLTDVLGLACGLGDGGAICVEVRGLEMTIDNYAPQDPEYLRIRLRVPVLEGLDTKTIDAGAASFTKDHKIVKVCRDRQNLVASAELLVSGYGQLPDPAHLAAILPRLFETLVRTAVAVSQTLQLEAALDDPGRPGSPPAG
jgi:hypothetical protein